MADERSQAGSPEADALVERGLKRYAVGELRAAMDDWEQALAIEPDCRRAREYLDYVCDNFDLLAAHFEAAAEAAALAAELDVPFGLETVGGEGDDYDLVEVAGGDGRRARAAVERYIESVDEGWFLDGEGEGEGAGAAAGLPLPPPTAEGGADAAGADEAEGQALVYEMEAELPPEEGDAGFPETPRRAGDPGFEVPDSAYDLAQQLVGAGDPAVDLEAPPLDGDGWPGVAPLALDSAGAAENHPTLELERDDLGSLPAASTALPGEAHPRAGDYDDERTVERRAGAHDLLPAVGDEEVTVPGGDEPLPFSEKLSLSHDALAALRSRGAVAASPEEQTVERPGVLQRGFALRNLDELEDGQRSDDRVLDDDDERPEVRVVFRHRAARPGDGYLDDELTTERRSAEPEAASGREPAAGGGRSPVLEEELTVERRSGSPGGPAVIVDESLLGEELETVDRRLEGSGRASSEAEFAAGQETRKLDRRAVSLSEDLSVNEVADAVLRAIDAEAVADESPDDRVRRRVTRLLEEAGRLSGDGRQGPAVAVAELALSEEPDSATAQKVVHRHRDLLLEIYELFLGDMRSVPTLAVPMHELATEQLDSRSVFLLSRLDGTLSLEEVLDVSGMPRLEAFRYLCRMVLRGILQVR